MTCETQNNCKLRYVDTIAQFPMSKKKQEFGDNCLTARKLLVMPMEARLSNFCLVVNGGGFLGSVFFL